MLQSRTLLEMFSRVPLGQRTRSLEPQETEQMLRQTEQEWNELQQWDQRIEDRDPRDERVDVYTPPGANGRATRFEGTWSEERMRTTRSQFSTPDPNGIADVRSEVETWRDSDWVFRFESHRSQEGATLRHYRLDRQHPENSTREDFFLSPRAL